MALPLKVWTGTEWIEVGSNAGQVYYSANVPTYAGIGDIWVESDSDNSVLSPSNFLTISSASTTYATKNSPAFTGIANFTSASVIFNSASVSGLPSGGGATVNSNILYNGAMQVSQRGTSTTSITTGGYYTADRWSLSGAGTVVGTWTQTIENDAPTGSGFRRSLKMLVTTAKANLAAGDNNSIGQALEGQDVQRIAKGTASAKKLTVSFWVKSNATGTYTAYLYDHDNTRFVSASYTISASATWEKKSVTFPVDTTGALDNDNAVSLSINFNLLAGTNFTSGTLGTTWATWTAANSAVGQTNLASATNNYWQVTGVQLETGDVATDFEFKSFGQELRECQRYYYRVTPGVSDVFGVGQCFSATGAGVAIPFPTTMRTEPTALEQSGTAGHYATWNASGVGLTNSAVPTFNSLTNQNVAWVVITVASGLTAGNATGLYSLSASAYLGWSAEL